MVAIQRMKLFMEKDLPERLRQMQLLPIQAGHGQASAAQPQVQQAQKKQVAMMKELLEQLLGVVLQMRQLQLPREHQLLQVLKNLIVQQLRPQLQQMKQEQPVEAWNELLPLQQKIGEQVSLFNSQELPRQAAQTPAVEGQQKSKGQQQSQGQ